MINIKNYRASNQNLWQGRADSLPRERYFQCVRVIDLTAEEILIQKQKAFAFLGFCCDEGIRRNLGRTGARKGPEKLRQMLAKLAVHAARDAIFFDVGDVDCESQNLEEAQDALAEITSQLFVKNVFPILLGGGHEISWGHYQGIARAKSKLKLGIINFDAHFDLRPLLADNKGSSGTSFRQIAKYSSQHNLLFNYLCLGIQRTANTRSLFEYADKLGVNYVVAEAFHENQDSFIKETLHEFIEKVDQIYLSICLDVFSSILAPGVSATQINGLFIHQAMPFLKLIAQSNKLMSIDIAELSPEHDHHDQTAALGAYLIAEIIESNFSQLNV